jgi:hypothetical protein
MPQNSRKPGTAALLTVLFAIGVLHWVFFYNLAHLSFTAYDWPKEFSYYSIIRQALIQHFIPYHVSRAFQETDRFLALPETLLSPQILLLPAMKIGQFAMFNTLFMYTLGFLGCLWLRKKYRLSFLPFLLLYLLFNFNGYITSHIAVGHSMWNGYFLMPFFCLLIFKLMEGKKNISLVVIEFSFFLFFLMLQGSFHIFVWCLFFLALFGAFNRGHLKSISLIIVFSAVLSCFRLCPAAMTFYKKGYPFLFISGYPGIKDFFNALATAREFTYRPFTLPMGWWEFDAYINIIGVIFIAYFGIYLRFSKKQLLQNYKYRELDFPILLMALFSFGSLYSFVSKLPVPFLNSQRYSSRFFIVPLILLLVISSLRLKELLPLLKKNKAFQLLAPACVAVIAFSLAKHSYLWRIDNLERHCGAGIADFTISNVIKNDAAYINSCKISAAVSLIAIAVLSYFYVYRARKPHSKGN